MSGKVHHKSHESPQKKPGSGKKLLGEVLEAKQGQWLKVKSEPVDLDKVLEGFRRWLRPEEEVTSVDIERHVLEIEE
jgi:hypothetical protein